MSLLLPLAVLLFVLSPQPAAAQLPTASITGAEMNEGHSGETAMSFRISLDKQAEAQASVRWETRDLSGSNTARAGEDYVAASGTAIIARGDSSADVIVMVKGDVKVEPDERFRVRLTGASNALVSSANGVANGTILNDDPPQLPTATIANAQANEGHSGETAMSFTISLSSPATDIQVSVNWETRDLSGSNTARAGEDYVAASGTVIIPQGDSSVDVTVMVKGDVKVEPDERFRVRLTGASGALVSSANGVANGLILNDDPPQLPTASIADAEVEGVEGHSGETDMMFTVSLTEASHIDVSVDWETQDLSGNNVATAGDDYVTDSGTLTIPAGDTVGHVIVKVKGDRQIEPDERFRVRLAGASGALLAGSTRNATGKICNDDIVPTVSVHDAEATEGDSGETEMSFRVSLSDTARVDARLGWRTQDLAVGDPASAGEDYVATSGFVMIPTGESVGYIVVKVKGDRKIEPDERFRVSLVSAAGAEFTSASRIATGTILNDDQMGLSIDDPSLDEGDSGSAALEFTVTLKSDATGTVTVDWATADGTASAGRDYTAGNGTLTFNAGDSAMTVSVPVTGDIVDEPDETFTVTLSNASGAPITDATGTGTIADDDAEPTVTLELDTASIDENGGVSAVTARLDRPSSEATTVTVSASPVSPAVAGDYALSSNRELTIPAGETASAGTVTITAVDNAADAPDKTVTVSATATNAQGIAGPQGRDAGDQERRCAAGSVDRRRERGRGRYGRRDDAVHGEAEPGAGGAGDGGLGDIRRDGDRRDGLRVGERNPDVRRRGGQKGGDGDGDGRHCGRAGRDVRGDAVEPVGSDRRGCHGDRHDQERRQADGDRCGGDGDGRGRRGRGLCPDAIGGHVERAGGVVRRDGRRRGADRRSADRRDLPGRCGHGARDAGDRRRQRRRAECRAHAHAGRRRRL